MRRALTWLPYLGLALLAVAVLVRGFRAEGLDLPEFPRPPSVDLPREVLAVASERLAGRVVDEAGAGIAEALVLAESGDELLWAYTDEQGYFALERVPAGELQLRVVARKFAPLQHSALGGSLDLLLVLDEPVPEPPSLPAIGESDLEGEVAAAIAGRVLLGYEVQLLPRDAPETLGAPIPVRAEVGADRTFRFEGLLHGTYRVRVLPPWARGGSWPDVVDPARAELVHGPSVRRLELKLRAGEIAGRLIDAEGEFVAGALVQVEPVGDPSRPWLPQGSDEEGAFLVADLPPGDYRLRVTAGEADLEHVVEVQAGTTSVVDLPPLAVGGGS